jgi:hypothetical protein
MSNAKGKQPADAFEQEPDAATDPGSEYSDAPIGLADLYDQQ